MGQKIDMGPRRFSAKGRSSFTTEGLMSSAACGHARGAQALLVAARGSKSDVVWPGADRRSLTMGERSAEA